MQHISEIAETAAVTGVRESNASAGLLVVSRSCEGLGDQAVRAFSPLEVLSPAASRRPLVPARQDRAVVGDMLRKPLQGDFWVSIQFC